MVGRLAHLRAARCCLVVTVPESAESNKDIDSTNASHWRSQIAQTSSKLRRSICVNEYC